MSVKMSSDNIQVAVRVRPFDNNENANTGTKFTIRGNEIFLADESGVRSGEIFNFDRIFDMNTTNSNIYDGVIEPFVKYTIGGVNSTIFAYGQTSSGKTYTMMGDDANPGIMQQAIKSIFQHVECDKKRQYLMRVSYIEIYNEKINDLLQMANKDIKIREFNGQIILQGVKEELVATPGHIFDLLKTGNQCRSIALTNMNENSSRSHTVFRISIESANNDDVNATDRCIQVSNLNLVDLAGSERAAQTKATGVRLVEGNHINKSLSALGLVIRQLSEKQDFINFRDSKLTRLLQDSLGGNSKTLIIATIKVASVDETISTLCFAKRAKTVKNKPRINEILTNEVLIKRYTSEIDLFKKELEEQLAVNKSLERDKEETSKKISNLQEKLQLLQFFQNGKTDKGEELPRRRHTIGFYADSKRKKLLQIREDVKGSSEEKHVEDAANSDVAGAQKFSLNLIPKAVEAEYKELEQLTQQELLEKINQLETQIEHKDGQLIEMQREADGKSNIITMIKRDFEKIEQELKTRIRDLQASRVVDIQEALHRTNTNLNKNMNLSAVPGCNLTRSKSDSNIHKSWTYVLQQLEILNEILRINDTHSSKSNKLFFEMCNFENVLKNDILNMKVYDVIHEQIVCDRKLEFLKIEEDLLYTETDTKMITQLRNIKCLIDLLKDVYNKNALIHSYNQTNLHFIDREAYYEGVIRERNNIINSQNAQINKYKSQLEHYKNDFYTNKKPTSVCENCNVITDKYNDILIDSKVKDNNIKDLNSEIMEYKVRLSLDESQLNELQYVLVALQKRIEESDDQNAKIEAQLIEYLRENCGKDHYITELHRVIQNTSSEKDYLGENVTKLRNDYMQTLETLNDKNEIIARNLEHVNELTAEIKQLKRENKGLQEEKEQLKIDTQQLDVERDTFLSENVKLIVEISDIKKNLTTDMMDESNLKQSNDEADMFTVTELRHIQETTELKIELDKYRSDLNKYRSDLENLNKKYLDELENKELLEKQIDDLNDVISAHKDKQLCLETECKASRNLIKKCNKNLVRMAYGRSDDSNVLMESYGYLTCNLITELLKEHKLMLSSEYRDEEEYSKELETRLKNNIRFLELELQKFKLKTQDTDEKMVEMLEECHKVLWQFVRDERAILKHEIDKLKSIAKAEDFGGCDGAASGSVTGPSGGGSLGDKLEAPNENVTNPLRASNQSRACTHCSDLKEKFYKKEQELYSAHTTIVKLQTDLHNLQAANTDQIETVEAYKKLTDKLKSKILKMRSGKAATQPRTPPTKSVQIQCNISHQQNYWDLTWNFLTEFLNDQKLVLSGVDQENEMYKVLQEHLKNNILLLDLELQKFKLNTQHSDEYMTNVLKQCHDLLQKCVRDERAMLKLEIDKATDLNKGYLSDIDRLKQEMEEQNKSDTKAEDLGVLESRTTKKQKSLKNIDDAVGGPSGDSLNKDSLQKSNQSGICMDCNYLKVKLTSIEKEVADLRKENVNLHVDLFKFETETTREHPSGALDYYKKLSDELGRKIEKMESATPSMMQQSNSKQCVEIQCDLLNNEELDKKYKLVKQLAQIRRAEIAELKAKVEELEKNK